MLKLLYQQNYHDVSLTHAWQNAFALESCQRSTFEDLQIQYVDSYHHPCQEIEYVVILN